MNLYFFDKVKSGKSLNIADIKVAIKTLQKIKEVGGVVVVTENNSLITTYYLNSYNKKLRSKK